MEQHSSPEVGYLPPLHTCVRNGEIICPDDLCRGTSTTLCGLEEGIDFGIEEYDPDYFYDEDDEGQS